MSPNTVARGKIIPDGNIKVLQSSETAIITSINVKESETVEKGDILIELDDTLALAEYHTALERLEIAEVEKALLEAYKNGENVDEISKSYIDKGITINPHFIDSLKNLNEVKSNDDSENLHIYELEVETANKSIDLAYAELKSIQMQIDIIDKRISDLKVLYEQGVVSKVDYEDSKNEKSLLVQSRNSQYETIEYYEKQKNIAEQKISTFESGRDIQLHQEIILKDKEIMEYMQALKVTEKRLELTKLRSPVTGMVQGIGNNTLGGVVTPAQSILSIVPNNTPLVLEALVMNRDLGFIEEGMLVEIKLDTFSFQKYGSVEGKVINISPDAIEQDGMGYVYKVLVSFEQSEIDIGDRTALITPGMTATAEIKLEKRRIIEFFIPAIDYVKDSVKHR